MADYTLYKELRTDKLIKRNGKYPIHLRIRISKTGNETRLSTQLEVEKEKWDSKKREPKDATLRIKLNKLVADLEMKINRTLADDQELTIELIKELYSGKRRSLKKENVLFFDYYKDFTERKRNEGLTEATLDKYSTTCAVLKEYKPQILISDINLQFVEKFDKFLINVRKNDKGWRFNRHKNLKTVILDMQKHGLQIENPYNFFKVPQPNPKETYLTLSEINKLKDVRQKLYHSSRTQWNILQMYLFSCFCGLRFSDTIALKWSDIDFEKKTQQKTKSRVNTPLLPQARAVVLLLSDGKKLLGTDKNIFHMNCFNSNISRSNLFLSNSCKTFFVAKVFP